MLSNSGKNTVRKARSFDQVGCCKPSNTVILSFMSQIPWTSKSSMSDHYSNAESNINRTKSTSISKQEGVQHQAMGPPIQVKSMLRCLFFSRRRHIPSEPAAKPVGNYPCSDVLSQPTTFPASPSLAIMAYSLRLSLMRHVVSKFVVW